MPAVDFVATFGTAVEQEFDQPIDELDQEDLAEAAKEHFDNLSEAELRSLYRDSEIEVDDPVAQ